MKLFENLINVILFYLLIFLTFFLPENIAKVIFIIDLIYFILFLVMLNSKANYQIKEGNTESLKLLMMNLVVFGLIQLALLYGLIGWGIL